MSEKLWQNDKTTNLEPVRTANRNGRLLLNVAQRETIKREKKKDKLLERRCPTHTQSAEACKKKKKILDYTKTPKKSSQELSRHWSSYHGFKRSLEKTGLEKGTR